MMTKWASVNKVEITFYSEPGVPGKPLKTSQNLKMLPVGQTNDLMGLVTKVRGQSILVEG